VKSLRSNIYGFLICIFLALSINSQLKAQSKIGVRWTAPDNSIQFDAEIEFLSIHHIDLIIIDEIPSSDQLLSLERFNIPFVIDLDNKYLTENNFNIRSGQLLTDIKSTAQRFDSSSTFAGILAFKHSSPSDSLSDIFSEYYIQQSDSLLRSNQTIGTVLTTLNPDASSLYGFKKQLEQDLTFVVVEFDWLEKTLEDNPEIKELLLLDQYVNPASIPLPKAPNQQPSAHWSVIVLVLLWISLAVNVAVNPTYLETIPRYFNAHRFFVDDIMSYRERSSASAIFLLFQHALFGGLAVYILAKTFISKIGLEALYYHLPYMAVLGQNYFSLFVLATILILLVELIALIWLYAPNKEMTHFNQALNLFTWIFHLDFILVTLMVTAYFAGLSALFISLLAVAYLLIWFSSFNITAFAASKRLGMNRNSYLMKTIALHTFISLLVLVFIITFDAWWDVLELVVLV